jgi:hypothetical protein
MQPATIKVFLVNGNPESLRTAEISNWTGKAVSAPRVELGDFLSRDELDRSGIYILVGFDPQTDKPALYVGEADSVIKRIKQHSNNDFWVNVVAFVSKDANLTKSHIKYLEGKLIEKAIEVDAAVVMNSVKSGTRLPESDAAEMSVFLGNIYQLLPILGISFFRTNQERTSISEEKVYCKIKDLVAVGKRSSTGFLVFSGSQAVLEHRPSAGSMRSKREELIKSGVLTRQGNHLVFVKDFEFGSPSTAGGVVRGGNTNGLTSWKNAEGKTLKDLEKL